MRTNVVNGDTVYVVVAHTPRTVGVVEGRYLAISEAGNDTLAWVDDSGDVHFVHRDRVFTKREDADECAAKLQATGWGGDKS